jgi:hypothetical protein
MHNVPMSTTTYDLAAAISTYAKAQYDLSHSRVGSPKSIRSDARIERLVAAAEAAGQLDAFLAAASDVRTY